MGHYWTVQDGDTLLSISDAEGFLDPMEIWNHSQNASLRELRKNPQVLARQDAVYIPDRAAPKMHSADTAKTHTFRLHRTPSYFTLHLHDECGHPYKNCRYTLVIEETRTFEGHTDETGMLCHPIQPSDRKAVLRLWPDPRKPGFERLWAVRVGSMDPVETIVGIKGRLRNLGYRVGPEDDDLDEVTLESLRDFQRHLGYEVPTGELDSRTRGALIDLHYKH
jgi:hypothetical protein